SGRRFLSPDGLFARWHAAHDTSWRLRRLLRFGPQVAYLIRQRCYMKRCLWAISAVVAATVGADAAMTSSEAARLASAARVVQDIQSIVPNEFWDRARCVMVLPEVKKAAFVIGGEYGNGVMSCRTNDDWSAPVFMQLAKGSWGFQIGAQQVDLVLLVMN